MADLALLSFCVNHFRGLRSLQLHGLGQVNVLLGGNNTGKTSVLEAMSVFCNPLDPMEWLSVIRRRDYGRMAESRLESLRWCLSQPVAVMDPQVFDASCEMSGAARHPVRTLQVKMRSLVGEQAYTDFMLESSEVGVVRRRRHTGVEGEQQNGMQITHELDGSPDLLTQAGSPYSQAISIQIWQSELFSSTTRIRRPFPVESLNPYTSQFNQNQVGRLSTASLTGNNAEIVDLLKGFDEDIEGVRVESPGGLRPGVYVTHRRLGAAPLSTFGDALRRAVFFATTLHRARNGLLLIDEAEAGFHVSAMDRVFTWLVKAASAANVQVVATTHSLEAVDALIAGSEKSGAELVAYHLDQTERGTEAKRFDDEMLIRLRRDRGLDLR